MAQLKVLELMLEKVRIDKEKTVRKGSTRRLVIATLVWPRPRIAARVSVKTLDLENNKADLTKSTWAEKILFKETVLGQFGIQVGVTNPVTESQAAKLIAFLGSSLLGLAGSEAKKVMSTSLEGGLIKLPFEYLAKLITASAGKDPKIPNSGIVDLHTAKTWQKKKSVRIEIPLKALQPIYRITRNKRGKGNSPKRQLIVKAGQINGSVVVSGKLY